MMPTAARMAGAVFFGILAWLISEMVKPLMPEGTGFGLFSEYNIAIGVLAGWIVMGTRADDGNRVAIGGGLTTSFAMMFWGLLIYSIIKMVKESLRMHYKGPVEAVIGTCRRICNKNLMLATPQIIGVVLIGGGLGGAFCGWVARRWP